MRKVDCFVYETASPPDFFNFWVFHGFCSHRPEGAELANILHFQMNQTEDDYLKIVAAKLGSLLAIGMLSFFCGVLPYYSIRAFRSRFPTSTVQQITSGFVCFSGGTLLGVTFLHLLPEVREKISQLQTQEHSLSFPKSLPLSDIIAMSGFFGVYLLDELLHMCVEWYSLRMKKLKARSNECRNGSEEERMCSQLPHDISVFSLDKHENSKHQVAICRRSNHHTTAVPSCVCQTQKPNPVDVADEKELLSINHDADNSDGKQETESKTDQRDEFPLPKKPQPMTPVSGLITIAALSFHDIFEGIAIGIEQDLSSILFLFLSIASHKYAIAFCIGMDLVAAGSRLKMIVLSMMTFSVVSPIGVIIGMIVVAERSEETKYPIDTPASVVMQGIAGGTLIYVVCFEVLQREGTDTHKKGIQNVMFVICGFLVTLGFKILTGHSHPQ